MMVAVGAISGARSGATDPNIAAMVWVGLVAMVVIGWGWPLLVVGTARAELVEAPTDAHVATPVPIGIALSGHGPGGAVEVRWADSTQWHAAQLAQGGSLTLIPAEGGIAERLRLELASSAPLEMVRVIRTVELELARPLYIAPVPVAEERPAALLPESGATPRSTAATGAGDVVLSKTGPFGQVVVVGARVIGLDVGARGGRRAPVELHSTVHRPRHRPSALVT